jgi:hypothetical protein
MTLNCEPSGFEQWWHGGVIKVRDIASRFANKPATTHHRPLSTAVFTYADWISIPDVKCSAVPSALKTPYSGQWIKNLFTPILGVLVQKIRTEN